MANRYKCNYRYFQSIDSEDKAYWLGFLYADGCVTINKRGAGIVHLGSSLLDIDHIRKFKSDIEAEQQIKHCVAHGKYPQVYICICSRNMCNDLINLGCIPCKTFKLNKLPDIDNHLIRYFLRGYHDGDGCNHITKSNYPILTGIGTKSFCSSILSYLGYGRISRKYSQYEYRFNGKNAIRFASYIYDGSSVSLKRKYYKAMRIINLPTSVV